MSATSEQAGTRAGPLQGIRVVELGTLVAGPFMGRMLADFGADVIKVELPAQGDPLRDWGAHRYKNRALWWPVQARNKRLITLNLNLPEGQVLCRRLLESADVLIENFRPGTLERWGLSPEELWTVNPRLVIARISGYGQDGPYAPRAGFASAGEAMGGLRYINGYPDQAPPRTGISLGDSLVAMFALQGTLMALYHRDVRGGLGQVVDASILESCFALLEGMVPDYGRLGVVREPTGTTLTHISPSNVYRSKDGKWIVIAANSPNLWTRLCAVIDRRDLLEDERFITHHARGTNMTALDAIIQTWVADRTASEVDRLMNDAGVVCGPVNSIADIFADVQVRARDMIVTMEDPELGPIETPNVVPKLSQTPGTLRWTGSWELGADNEAVYGRLLGLGPAEMTRLKAEGVI
jgi:crotonobetainyl-CoA:carnitine CoA-transferase CaiB-like acyl-CoA transferase